MPRRQSPEAQRQRAAICDSHPCMRVCVCVCVATASDLLSADVAGLPSAALVATLDGVPGQASSEDAAETS